MKSPTAIAILCASSYGIAFITLLGVGCVFALYACTFDADLQAHEYAVGALRVFPLLALFSGAFYVIFWLSLKLTKATHPILVCVLGAFAGSALLLGKMLLGSLEPGIYQPFSNLETCALLAGVVGAAVYLLCRGPSPEIRRGAT